MSECQEIRLSIEEPRSDADLVELRAALSSAPPDGFLEVWIDHSPYPSLCALVNGAKGWLMCLRYDGDAGFSSRNPRYAGPVEAKIQYQLANGQMDEYPASWAYPREEVFEALLHFARHRKVPDAIEWFNDAGDGKKSPNQDF
jgi:hypothetical protein